MLRRDMEIPTSVGFLTIALLAAGMIGGLVVASKLGIEGMGRALVVGGVTFVIFESWTVFSVLRELRQRRSR
jgi:hypothetical protein